MANSKASVIGSSKAHDSAALESSRGLVGGWKKLASQGVIPTSWILWLLQQLVVSTRTCPPEEACIPLDPLLRWFCSIWPWPSCWPRGLYLVTRREWLPIAALSHHTEDAVTCDSTTPLPRLSYLGVLALPFESCLKLSFHPCPTGCTSWFGNSQEENTSVTMLTRTKLSVIHYTF